jgi:hypothetical protein
MSPLPMALFTRPSIAPVIWEVAESKSFEGPPTIVFSAGAMICLAAM